MLGHYSRAVLTGRLVQGAHDVTTLDQSCERHLVTRSSQRVTKCQGLDLFLECHSQRILPRLCPSGIAFVLCWATRGAMSQASNSP